MEKEVVVEEEEEERPRSGTKNTRRGANPRKVQKRSNEGNKAATAAATRMMGETARGLDTEILISRKQMQQIIKPPFLQVPATSPCTASQGERSKPVGKPGPPGPAKARAKDLRGSSHLELRNSHSPGTYPRCLGFSWLSASSQV